MILLAIGILLWSAAHLLRRLAPDLHERLGGRVGMALMILAALALMIFGYRTAEGAFFWGRDPMKTGINNLMMLIAIWCFACAGMKTALARKVPYLMLWGVVIWVLAHLLVNGDTPSFLLFGGLGIWALLQMLAINRQEGGWTPPAPRPAKMEAIALAGTAVVFGAIALAHTMLGYPVFG